MNTGTSITLTSLETALTGAVNAFITIAVLAVVGFIVYGGIKMAMSQGDEQAYKAGKNIIRNAIIGGLVILGVSVIINTIANFAQNPSGAVR